MVKTKIKVGYVMKKFILDQNSISEFEILSEERRKLRDGKISKLFSKLKKGEHFESPFIINIVNDKKRLIDGNHRYEAIKDYLALDEKNSVEIWIAEYKNLNGNQISKIRQEENKIFRIWHSGTTQTPTDFLKMHWEFVPLGKEILKMLPTSIYGNNKKFPVKHLFVNHFEAVRQGSFVGQGCYSPEKTVKMFENITMSDINHIKAWYADMEEIFGPYYKRHPFYTTTAQSTFYRIWYDNKSSIPRDVFIKAFKEVFVMKQGKWMPLVNSGGNNASAFFYKLAIDDLNTWRKNVVFQ